MSRRITSNRSDWLRSMTSTRPAAPPLPTLLPAVSDPTPSDMLKSMIAAVLVGAIMTAAAIMAIVS